MSKHHFSIHVDIDSEPSEVVKPSGRNSRALIVRAAGKDPIRGSAAQQFHGDAARWNPEELLLAALAECHLLSLMYVATRDGIALEDCSIEATAELEVNPDGSGRITLVELSPRTLAPGVPEEIVLAAHQEAHRLCFIAGSVSCEVRVLPHVVGGSAPDTQG